MPCECWSWLRQCAARLRQRYRRWAAERRRSPAASFCAMEPLSEPLLRDDDERRVHGSLVLWESEDEGDDTIVLREGDRYPPEAESVAYSNMLMRESVIDQRLFDNDSMTLGLSTADEFFPREECPKDGVRHDGRIDGFDHDSNRLATSGQASVWGGHESGGGGGSSGEPSLYQSAIGARGRSAADKRRDEPSADCSVDKASA